MIRIRVKIKVFNINEIVYNHVYKHKEKELRVIPIRKQGENLVYKYTEGAALHMVSHQGFINLVRRGTYKLEV